MEAPAETLQNTNVFSATLQKNTVFNALIKVRQLCLRHESCRESIGSVQLSRLRHTCLTLKVELNTLINCNVTPNTLRFFCKVEDGASILQD